VGLSALPHCAHLHARHSRTRHVTVFHSLSRQITTPLTRPWSMLFRVSTRSGSKLQSLVYSDTVVVIMIGTVSIFVLQS
jgi:hypothetical protein